MDVHFYNSHHMAFSNSLPSWELLWPILGVYPPRSFLRVLIFHVIYPSSLSVMFFLFPYFTPKLFYFLYPVVDSSSCIPDWLLGRVSFFFPKYPILLVLLDPVSVSFQPPFFQHLLIYLFKLHYQTCLLFCFDLFIRTYPRVLFLPLHFCLLLKVIYQSF